MDDGFTPAGFWSMWNIFFLVLTSKNAEDADAEIIKERALKQWQK